MIELLNREKKMYDGCDGLISRFLIASPKPVRLSLLSLQPIPEKTFQIRHLLSAVLIINRNIKINENSTESKQLLKFDEVAFKKLNEIFNEYDQIAQKFEVTNSFIR